jgi:hypothetical protein
MSHETLRGFAPRAGAARTCAAAALLLLLAAGDALAQEPVRRATRLPAFGRSAVSNEDTTALVQNPANIAFLPAAELRWSSVYLDEAVQVPWQGHAFGFGVPIPFIPLATAVRFDAIDPPAAAEPVGPTPLDRLGNYQWLTWGLALRASERAAFGFSLQRAFSEETTLVHALSSWSLGFTTRPFDFLGLAVVFNDVNGPRNEANGRLERSYDFALAVRPFSSRVVELGLEGKLVDAEPDSYWIPRATLGIDLPPLGRLRTELSMSRPEESSDRAFVAAASLALFTNNPGGSGELSLGSVFGNGLGPDQAGRKRRVMPCAFASKIRRRRAGTSPCFASCGRLPTKSRASTRSFSKCERRPARAWRASRSSAMRFTTCARAASACSATWKTPTARRCTCVPQPTGF